jgi:hypothetical protein
MQHGACDIAPCARFGMVSDWTSSRVGRRHKLGRSQLRPMPRQSAHTRLWLAGNPCAAVHCTAIARRAVTVVGSRMLFTPVPCGAVRCQPRWRGPHLRSATSAADRRR